MQRANAARHPLPGVAGRIAVPELRHPVLRSQRAELSDAVRATRSALVQYAGRAARFRVLADLGDCRYRGRQSFDRTGTRKPILIGATLVFALCSGLSGIVGSFVALFCVRLFMGIAEGGVLPVSQALTVMEIAPQRRGLAMGFMQNFGSNLLGSTAASLVLLPFAAHFGWRKAFFLAAVPGVVSAVLIAWLIHEPARDASGTARAERMSMGQALAQRNILLCVLISIVMVSHLVICFAFMPLFLAQVRGFRWHDVERADRHVGCVGRDRGVRGPGHLGLRRPQADDDRAAFVRRHPAARRAVLYGAGVVARGNLLCGLDGHRHFPAVHGDDSLRDCRPTVNRDGASGFIMGAGEGSRRRDLARSSRATPLTCSACARRCGSCSSCQSQRAFCRSDCRKPRHAAHRFTVVGFLDGIAALFGSARAARRTRA